jgi:hypothetical protein
LQKLDAPLIKFVVARSCAKSLANSLEYLRFKSNQLTVKKASEENNFLMAIAGLGESDETDLSERDEEILAQEIDSIYGFYQGENNE